MLIPLILSAAMAFGSSDILAPYQWHKRLLLIFAASEEDASYEQQYESLASYPLELKDRDVLIFHVFAQDGTGPEGRLTAEVVQTLRQQYKIATTFTVVLVGKDGAIKRRENQPVSALELFTQIDSMPMRQREMQSQPED